MITQQTKFKENPLYIKGHVGEVLVSQILQSRGWYIVPSYDYSGSDDKAPRMQGQKLCYILPDLDVSKQGEERAWVEVKTKEEAVEYRKTHTLRHGISLKHYKHYQEVEKISGCAVYLAVYEIKTGDVLMAKLSSLAKHVQIYEGDKMDYGGMAWFPRDAFDLLETVTRRP